MNAPVVLSARLARVFSTSAWRLIVLALSMALALTACGGGGGISLSGGVGSGGSGIAEGSVTGFGSVIVDGIEYDDTDASREVGDADGKTSAAEVKLGQRVRVEQSQEGKASRILVVPQLRGPVTQAWSGGFIKVLGQWVQIVDATGTGNPPTVLDGYSALTGIAVNDAIEVHGVWVNSGGSQGYVLLASRIEKLSGAPLQYLLSGTVTRRNGNDLNLNADSRIELRSPGDLPSTIQPDAQVSAWVAAATWNQSANSGRVTLLRLDDGSPPVASQQVLKLGIPVRQSDVKNGKLTIQGLVIQVPAQWLSALPSEDRKFVQVEVLKQGDSYVLQGVQTGSGGTTPGEKIELKGAIFWPQSASTLRLRDTTVSVPPGSLGSGCRDIRPGAPVFVELKAARTAPGSIPVATSVQCQASIPGGSVREISGLLQIPNPASKRIVISDGTRSLTLEIAAGSVVPSALADWNGRAVEAQYLSVGDTNVLRQIKLER